MSEQGEFCEEIVADLMRVFPDYPAAWFTSNVATAKLGGVLTITMPSTAARNLLDAYLNGVGALGTTGR